MANVKFKRRKSNQEIENIPIEDGNFIITKDGNIYSDFGNERIRVSYNSGLSIDGLLISLGLDTDTYSKNQTYEVGDIIIYKHAIYECKTAVVIPEEFDFEKWNLIPLITN